MSVCIVTGCSSGFGWITSRLFAERGHTVYATVRSRTDAARLRKAAEAEDLKLIPSLLELAYRPGIRRFVDSVLEESGRIDVLINNAGIAIQGALEDLRGEDIDAMLNVNLVAPLALSRAVLPAMRAQGRGHIIMVSSLSALVGLPGDTLYCASKAALEAAAEGLRHEVDRFGVRVSVIEPGLFETAMPEKIAATARCPDGSVYAPLSRHLGDGMRRRLGEGDDPLRVARLLLRIAGDEEPRFRYPAGAQAEQVVARLAALGADERETFVKQVHDTAWWSEGAPQAPEEEPRKGSEA